MFELIILVLTVQWLLGFFGLSIFPHILPMGGFIDVLAVIIVVLIGAQFLAWL